MRICTTDFEVPNVFALRFEDTGARYQVFWRGGQFVGAEQVSQAALRATPVSNFKASTGDNYAILLLYLAEHPVQSAAPLPNRSTKLGTASAFALLRVEFLLSPLGLQVLLPKIEALPQHARVISSAVLHDALS